MGVSGKIIPWEKLPRTKVYLLRGSTKHYAAHFQLSSYKKYVDLGHITHRRPAGASQADYGKST